VALAAAVSERFQNASERLEQSRGHGEIEATAMIEKGLSHFGLCKADLAELRKAIRGSWQSRGRCGTGLRE